MTPMHTFGGWVHLTDTQIHTIDNELRPSPSIINCYHVELFAIHLYFISYDMASKLLNSFEWLPTLWMIASLCRLLATKALSIEWISWSTRAQLNYRRRCGLDDGDMRIHRNYALGLELRIGAVTHKLSLEGCIRLRWRRFRQAFDQLAEKNDHCTTTRM